jgi:plasmid maintenance system antidote protein VapI
MNSKRVLANDLVSGSATHPGSLLKAELELRGMKQKDLASQLGIAKNVMSELVNGKLNITPEIN